MSFLSHDSKHSLTSQLRAGPAWSWGGGSHVPVFVPPSAVKRSRAVSDDENSDSDVGVGGPDRSLAAKLRELGSDSGSEDDDTAKAAAGKKDEKALFGSDSDSGDDNEEE